MRDVGISVVIQVLNEVETIGRQLDACLAQECPVPFEVVVADDGSTDGTVGVLERYAAQDDRVRVIDASTEKPGGSGAKNAAVRAARAPRLAFCDGDDVVSPGWLRAVHAALEEADTVVVSRELWSLNPVYGRTISELKHEASFGRVTTLCGGAFGMTKALYEAVGGFDDEFPGSADFDFGIRVYRHTGKEPVLAQGGYVSVQLVSTPLAGYRRARALARSRPLLLRRHRDALTISNRRIFLASCLSLVREIPGAVRKKGLRIAWSERLGTIIGECQGHWLLWRAGRAA